MNSNTTKLIQEKLCLTGLPLAVYREIAAHLRQVLGVKAELVTQTSSNFDYLQSQIDHLWLQYPEEIEPKQRQQLEAIINYYAQIHGTWQRQQIESN